MSTLRDLYGGTAYQELPHIQQEEIRLLWVDAWYDGPIDGVALYRGKRLCFQMVNDRVMHDATWFRAYILIEPTPEQERDLVRWQRLFQDKVGTHWDYNADGRPNGPTFLKPAATHRAFYDALTVRVEPEYASPQVVGWFELEFGSLAADDGEAESG